jgi:hypothetical protein
MKKFIQYSRTFEEIIQDSRTFEEIIQYSRTFAPQVQRSWNQSPLHPFLVESFPKTPRTQSGSADLITNTKTIQTLNSTQNVHLPIHFLGKP